MLGVAGAIAQLTGCGGGGGSDFAGLSTGGTGSFTNGTITGVGSIIVNGIRYNNDTATVLHRDDGTVANVSLQLGMVVAIEGSSVVPATTVNGTPTATATRIIFGSEWLGPVGTKSVNSFEVLGHTVDVLATTIFDGEISQYSALTSLHYVEVYGYVDQVNGRIQASRVEATSIAPTTYKLSGNITQIDLINRTASMGTTPVSWSAGVALPAGLTSGSFVRVQIDPGSISGVWNLTRIQLLTSPLVDFDTDDGDEAEIHGSITSYQSSASFSVNGIPVDASRASITGTLASGVSVEVKGSITSQQVIATQVEVQDSSVVAAREFEFHGMVSNLNTSASTFVLGDYTFTYNSNTQYEGVDWSVNPSPYVEVNAIYSDGVWIATEIELEALGT